MEAKNTLKEPFPTKILELLDFGSADGRKDESLEETFVLTTSVRRFLQDRHSIIIGSIGSGKSALFELLKNKSEKLSSYRNRVIVPIEESMSFSDLRTLVSEELAGSDHKLIYKLIWKFQILNRLCEEICKLPNFPKNSHEKEIKDYLKNIGSREVNLSVIDKLKILIKNTSLVVTTKISESPISIEAKISSGIENRAPKVKLDLDRIYNCVIRVFESRKELKPLVIIDRIDTFVAGEDYDTQREFIGALLEVDYDIDIVYPTIGRKIFLRTDLFVRLDNEALGYDKVNDNTLRIDWNDSELLDFVAKRILSALKKEKMLTQADILLSTDLSDYPLAGVPRFMITNMIPLKLRKKIFSLINQERDVDTSLLNKLNQSTITKVFPRKIAKIKSSNDELGICIFEFLTTHFRDGHGKTMPRNLLTFLKEVATSAGKYYTENPDQEIHAKNINGNWEWDLFKERCVYDAYCNAKHMYIVNAAKISNEWTSYFSTFIRKRYNKKTIEFNWVKTITALDEEKTIQFIAYLNHIGFLSTTDTHPDPIRRKYRIPIIYAPIYNT